MGAALQEERFRVERLEEQINDLTELHQNEVWHANILLIISTTFRP